MQVHSEIGSMRAALADWRARGESVGVVPTMGYLHAGHLKLVERACAENDVVVVTIFVNPTQFGPNEDLDAYPRDLERDLAQLAAFPGVQVFAPTVAEMYPQPLQTSVDLAPLGQILIGAARPGHFRGVATVVTKLFNIVQPDRAYFGEKDYQQLTVIRRMVADLSSPITIVGVPTVREADGLAMSSRNVRLTPEDRDAAVVLARALDRGEALLRAGAAEPEPVLAAMREIIAAEPRADLASLDIRDAASLDAVTALDERPVVILVTARFGDVLLIDQRVAEKAHGSATGGKAA
ncbi:pantoate--beta-alanine ligase [Aurantimonas coralicida]|uniref:pantoate--beta-alanine ligase n=1 Tax=Aurantimonas coralicida TaxID=182270 RepID=UPI00238CBA82|nr:pantoate--beta-alanine ligase [Aurantimonas coralicida]MDE0921918.1 pantoate--beta-alanine ligase [Aurantimonas coralicida]